MFLSRIFRVTQKAVSKNKQDEERCFKGPEMSSSIATHLGQRKDVKQAHHLVAAVNKQHVAFKQLVPISYTNNCVFSKSVGITHDQNCYENSLSEQN